MHAKTHEFLQEAMIGEKNAAAKYACYAQRALEENLPNIAYLFHALSQAEHIHLKNHQNALKDPFQPEVAIATPLSSRENLRDAVDGETNEYKRMYPRFIKEIKQGDKSHEGKVALLSMQWALDVEKTHAEALQKALHALEKGNDLSVTTIYICKVCGNLVFSIPTKECPVCGHDPQFYTQIARPERIL